jgi:hypothetical protein
MRALEGPSFFCSRRSALTSVSLLSKDRVFIASPAV